MSITNSNVVIRTPVVSVLVLGIFLSFSCKRYIFLFYLKSLFHSGKAQLHFSAARAKMGRRSTNVKRKSFKPNISHYNEKSWHILSLWIHSISFMYFLLTGFILAPRRERFNDCWWYFWTGYWFILHRDEPSYSSSWNVNVDWGARVMA